VVLSGSPRAAGGGRVGTAAAVGGWRVEGGVPFATKHKNLCLADKGTGPAARLLVLYAAGMTDCTSHNSAIVRRAAGSAVAEGALPGTRRRLRCCRARAGGGPQFKGPQAPLIHVLVLYRLARMIPGVDLFEVVDGDPGVDLGGLQGRMAQHS
jgi:hypothetical protein